MLATQAKLARLWVERTAGLLLAAVLGVSCASPTPVPTELPEIVERAEEVGQSANDRSSNLERSVDGLNDRNAELLGGVAP